MVKSNFYLLKCFIPLFGFSSTVDISFHRFNWAGRWPRRQSLHFKHFWIFLRHISSLGDFLTTMFSCTPIIRIQWSSSLVLWMLNLYFFSASLCRSHTLFLSCAFSNLCYCGFFLMVNGTCFKHNNTLWYATSSLVHKQTLYRALL